MDSNKLKLEDRLKKVEVTEDIRDLMATADLNPDAVYQVLKDGLEATKSIPTPAGILVQVPDHAIRLKAAEKMLDIFKHVPKGNSLGIVNNNFTFAQMVIETFEENKTVKETKTIIQEVD